MTNRPSRRVLAVCMLGTAVLASAACSSSEPASSTTSVAAAPLPTSTTASSSTTTPAANQQLFSKITEFSQGGDLLSDDHGVFVFDGIYGVKSILAYSPDGQQRATTTYPASDGIDPVPGTSAVIVGGSDFPRLAVETATLHPPAGVQSATVDYNVTLYDGSTFRRLWTNKVSTETTPSASPSDIRPRSLTATIDSKWIVVEHDPTSYIIDTSSGRVRQIPGEATAVGDHVAILAQHKAVVLDPVTLAPRWVADPGVGGEDKRIQALEATVKQRWFIDGDHALVAPAGIALSFDIATGRIGSGFSPDIGRFRGHDDEVLVSRDTSRIYAVGDTMNAYDAHTLQRIWEQSNVSSVYAASPTTVFVRTTSGQWAALSAVDGHQVQYAADPGPSYTSQVVSGKYLWRSGTNGTTVFRVLD